ncbi:hypothetical protein PT274_03735 [Leuconostocaceae bacterium ESL0958]|nr:hypothetical protein [Leuconostocaceae bacterium ESL0958]
MGKAPAYILLPTLLLLSCGSFLLFCQLFWFDQRLKASQASLQEEKIRLVQIQASADYLRTGREQGRLAAWTYTCDSATGQVIIQGDGQVAKRPLYQTAPCLPKQKKLE